MKASKNYSLVIVVLILFKWATLIIALLLAYRYDLWVTFAMIFVMVYGGQLDERINRVKKIRRVLEELEQTIPKEK